MSSVFSIIFMFIWLSQAMLFLSWTKKC